MQKLLVFKRSLKRLWRQTSTTEWAAVASKAAAAATVWPIPRCFEGRKTVVASPLPSVCLSLSMCTYVCFSFVFYARMPASLSGWLSCLAWQQQAAAASMICGDYSCLLTTLYLPLACFFSSFSFLQRVFLSIFLLPLPCMDGRIGLSSLDCRIVSFLIWRLFSVGGNNQDWRVGKRGNKRTP